MSLIKLKIKNKKIGLTLVEVMVAVFFIGFLALSIFLILDYIKINSTDANKVADLQKINKVLELYYDQNAEYPKRLDDLVLAGFINEIPIPPAGSKQVVYSYVPIGANGICTGFHLGASLRSKENQALKSDSDSRVGMSCVSGVRDFDGTAVYCQSGVAGEGIKNDTCFDIRR